MFDIKPEVNIKTDGNLAQEIYTDLAKPTCQGVGKTIGGIAKLFQVIVGVPAELASEYAEKRIRDFADKLENKVETIPIEQRVEPSFSTYAKTRLVLPKVIAEPLIEDLFLNLILSSMDKRASGDYLPYFPDIISALSPDEAKILKLMSSRPENSAYAKITVLSRLPNNGKCLEYRNVSLLGEDSKCDIPQKTPAYLDNLSRLGLVDLIDDMRLQKETAYKRIIDGLALTHLPDNNPGPEGYDPEHFEIVKGIVRLSSLGISFCRACKINDVS